MSENPNEKIEETRPEERTPSEGAPAEGESAQDVSREEPAEENIVETLKATIAQLEQSVATYKDQLLRKAAEFENYKKRVDNDFAVLTKFANEELIVQLLPILDDLRRSLKAASEQRDGDSLYRGVELIYTKFLKTLELQGVKEIEAIGKPFDVYYHDALMEIPRDDVPHHTVIDEVEKGYTLHGKVIRHAKVILSSQPALQQAVDAPGHDRTEQPGSDNETDKR